MLQIGIKTFLKAAWARKGWKRVFAAICNGTEGFLRSRMPGFKEKTVRNEEKAQDGN